MIGAGAVGAGIAWHLARRGHGITLYDPRLSEPSKLDPSEHPNGTSASLGVLMGHVFRRSSGRGWRLRQRSMELWPQWVDALAGFNPALTLRTPLLQLALDEKTLMHQRVLASKRPHLNLQMVESADCPLPCVGGLLSHQDGRVDPLVLQSALRRAMDSLPIEPIATSVCGLHCDDIAQDQWQVETVAGHRTRHRAVVLCAGRDCQPLLDALGQVRPMTPVLGQALELQLHAGPATWEGWPAVLVTGGFNLIPIAPGRLLLGATVEPGDHPDPKPLALMQGLSGTSPDWLDEAKPVRQWSGLRARPVDRPAPLLEELKPGLVLASGHYRNGVLLSPATAEWVEHTLSTRGCIET